MARDVYFMTTGWFDSTFKQYRWVYDFGRALPRKFDRIRQQC